MIVEASGCMMIIQSLSFCKDENDKTKRFVEKFKKRCAGSVIMTP